MNVKLNDLVHGTRTSKGWVRLSTMCGRIITERLELGEITDDRWTVTTARISCSICRRVLEAKAS